MLKSSIVDRERAKKWYYEHRKNVLERAKKYHVNNADKIRKRVKEWRKNNPWEHQLNKILFSARRRCHNPKEKAYKWYGARGIKMLLTKADLKFIWKRDCADKMKCPSLDRIDNDGDYRLDNCRFIENQENFLKRFSDSTISDDKKKIVLKQIEEYLAKNKMNTFQLGRYLGVGQTTVWHWLYIGKRMYKKSYEILKEKGIVK